MVNVNSLVSFEPRRTIKLYSRTSALASKPTYWTFTFSVIGSPLFQPAKLSTRLETLVSLITNRRDACLAAQGPSPSRSARKVCDSTLELYTLISLTAQQSGPRYRRQSEFVMHAAWPRHSPPHLALRHPRHCQSLTVLRTVEKIKIDQLLGSPVPPARQVLNSP